MKILKDNTEFVDYNLSEELDDDFTFDEKVIWTGIGCLVGIILTAIYLANYIPEY